MNIILATPRVIQVKLQTGPEPIQGKIQTTIIADKADLACLPPFRAAVELAPDETVEFSLSVAGGSGLVTIQSGEWPRGCGPTQQHLLGSTGKVESQRIGMLYVEPPSGQEAPAKIVFTYFACGVLDYKSANISGRIDLGQVSTVRDPSTYYIALEVAPGAKGTLDFDKVPKKGGELLKLIEV